MKLKLFFRYCLMLFIIVSLTSCGTVSDIFLTTLAHADYSNNSGSTGASANSDQVAEMTLNNLLGARELYIYNSVTDNTVDAGKIYNFEPGGFYKLSLKDGEDLLRGEYIFMNSGSFCTLGMSGLYTESYSIKRISDGSAYGIEGPIWITTNAVYVEGLIQMVYLIWK